MFLTQFSLGTNRISLRLRGRNHPAIADLSASQGSEIMLAWNDEAAIAAFIRAKGIMRCPTACAAPTHASGSVADRDALRQRAERLEASHQERARHAWARAFG
jgi:hypothetical protein